MVDLRDASFIDSTTLGVLLVAHQRAEQSSVGFALVLPDRDYTEVHQILDLTGLGLDLRDLRDARRSARGGSGGPHRSAAVRAA